MTERKRPHAIGTVFKGALAHMAGQAWLVGHLDAATLLLQVVEEEARENLVRHPKDETTKAALLRIQVALANITQVAEELGQIAVGEQPNG